MCNFNLETNQNLEALAPELPTPIHCNRPPQLQPSLQNQMNVQGQQHLPESSKFKPKTNKIFRRHDDRQKHSKSESALHRQAGIAHEEREAEEQREPETVRTQQPTRSQSRATPGPSDLTEFVRIPPGLSANFVFPQS